MRAADVLPCGIPARVAFKDSDSDDDKDSDDDSDNDDVYEPSKPVAELGVYKNNDYPANKEQRS